MVHRLATKNVSAVVRETGFRLAGQAEERPLPQKLRRRALGESHELLRVLLAKRAVDQQEVLDQASLILQLRGLAHDGWNDVLQEFPARRLVQIDGIGMKFLGKNLVVEAGQRLVSHVVASDKVRDACRINVIRI